MLRIKRRRLQMLLHEFPFYRMIGRRKVFTRGDLEKIVEALPQPSASSLPARGVRRTGASGGRTLDATLTLARDLLNQPSPKQASGAKSVRSGTGVVDLDKARAGRPRKSDD